MSKLSHLALLTTFAAAAAVTGCGGGGGDSGSPSPPAQAQRVQMSAGNSSAVAAQAVDAGSGSFFGSAVGVSGVQVDVDAQRGRSPIAMLATALRKVRDAAARPSLLAGALSDPEVFPCTTSGEVSIAVDAGSDGELSPGDALVLAFSACVEEPGTRLDGRLGLTLTAVNADATAFTARAEATDLLARVGTLGQRANGALTIRFDESNATTNSLVVTSDSFTIDRLRGNVVRATRTLLDYEYRLTTVIASGRSTETISTVVTGDFPLLGEVSFVVDTTVPIVTPLGAERPTSGAILVTGRGGSTLDVIAVANGVRLELDLGGNGTIDATRTLTWAQLEAELLTGGRAGAAAALVALALAAAARPAAAVDGAPPSASSGWQLDAALHAHRLRETSASGATLLTEEGASPALRLHRRWAPGEGGWGARIALGGFAGTADYDGRTQAGTPARSRTRTQQLAFEALAVQAVAPGVSVDTGVRGEYFRRRIEGVDGNAGLDERLALAFGEAGIAWRGATTGVRCALRAAPRGPLDVRFDDDVYDRVGLRSGRATGWVLEAEQALARGWSLAGGVEALRVGAGRSAPLRQDGVAVGRVAQPAWTRQRAWIGLRRAFE